MYKETERYTFEQEGWSEEKKAKYFAKSAMINDFMASNPINQEFIKGYPGSSKGKRPEDNPEHFNLWL
jgi:hypothetical protein